MSDLMTRKAEIEKMIATASLLDDKGEHEAADQLTKIAAKQVQALEDDVDAEDADAPVSTEDPMAKGFGKSLNVLSQKLERICGANNCHKKLEDLCKGKSCDSDELYITLRKASKLLKQLVG